jgi:Rieske Fe-S protein
VIDRDRLVLLMHEKPGHSRVASILPTQAREQPLPAAEDHAMPDRNTSVSRRRFCAGACQVASCATLATLFSACDDGPSSPTSPSGTASKLGVLAGRFTGSGVQATVAGSALGEVGGAVLVESTAGVFLIARTSESTFSAIDAVCTHEGCTITGADGSTYVCPCHGSRYNRSGQVLAGPARASLRQYATTFTSGVVTIAL